MNANIISDYSGLKEYPRMIQFSVVFTDINGRKEEFIFYDYSITNCVGKCTALINYMFQIQGVHYVYIFPVNITLSYRNVYSRTKGMMGRYKLLKCQPNRQLTFYQVRLEFLNY